MKAYQLKIKIDHSHPPIWRRFIVPAGLSFSQLAIVLNEVMGWRGTHLSAFEFYHLALRMEEQPDEMDEYDGYGGYDLLDSASTMIEPYLDCQEWFSYIYDFGDEWSHCVTVEKRIPDYEKSWPTVLKFKGETPYEDCGGIDGYYNLLDILKDPSHPEYKSMQKWTEKYPAGKYDLYKVNKTLQKLSLGSRRSKPMSQNEIWDEVFIQGKPLRQIQGDMRIPVMEYEDDDFDDYDDTYDDALWKMLEKEKEYFRRRREMTVSRPVHPEKTQVADILGHYRKSDMTEIAKRHSIGRYRQYNKEALADYLGKQILEKDTMRRYFLFLEDEEIELFERADGYIEEEWPCQEEYVLAGGYGGLLENGDCLIPEEVCRAYHENCDPKWKAEREHMRELLDYMNTAVELNGCCSLDTVREIYREGTGREADIDEMYRLFWAPEEKRFFDEVNGILVMKGFTDWEDIEAYLEGQSGKGFYIPTPGEVRSLSRKGYLPFDIYLKRLKTFLTEELSADPKEAESVCCQLQGVFRCGSEDMGYQEILEAGMEEFPELDPGKRKALSKLLKDVQYHTRMMVNRGYTLAEMDAGADKRPGKAGSSASKGSTGKIIQFTDRIR